MEKGQRLSWAEIKENYNQEWVELVDYDWPDGTPYPNGGSVRIHAADKKHFYALIKEKGDQPSNSAIVYVGTPPYNCNCIYVNPAKFASWK